MIGGAQPLSTAGRGGRGHPRHRPPSTSPRRWAEGYDDHTLVARRYDALQRHLGTWPRDTGLNCHTPIHIPSLQRHLGARPRDTTHGRARRYRTPSFNVTSALGRGIFGSGACRRPGLRPFNVTSAFGRGIRRSMPGSMRRFRPFNVTSALGRGIRGRRGGRRDRRRPPSTSPRRLAEGYDSTLADVACADGLQRHLGAGPRDTVRGRPVRVRVQRPSTSPRRWAEGYRPPARRTTPPARPFNVTSALGRGILTAQSPIEAAEISLQRHLGAWPRDTQRRVRDLDPRQDLQRHLGAGPRDTRALSFSAACHSNLQRHLGAGPRDTAQALAIGDVVPHPSTSPRRWAEGYALVDRLALVGAGVLQRHLGAGPRDTVVRVTRWRRRPDLQRHLGAGPRDTPSTPASSSALSALQRHLGAGPRDTAASRAVDSRRIFPLISRASPFLAFHAFRGIGRERASR